MRKVIPINVTSEGIAPTLTAVYYKKGAYNFLKDTFLQLGGHSEHTEIAVMEIIDGEVEDTAGDQ